MGRIPQHRHTFQAEIPPIHDQPKPSRSAQPTDDPNRAVQAAQSHRPTDVAAEPAARAGRKGLCWDDLATIEPSLLRLELRIRKSTPPRESLAFWPMWEIWKSEIKAIAGFNAENPELQSSEAYEIAHNHLVIAYDDAAGAREVGA